MAFKECKECDLCKAEEKCDLEKMGEANMEIGEIGEIEDLKKDKVCKNFKQKAKCDK